MSPKKHFQFRSTFCILYTIILLLLILNIYRLRTAPFSLIAHQHTHALSSEYNSSQNLPLEIVVFHARKAAGTTVFRWAKKFRDIVQQTPHCNNPQINDTMCKIKVIHVEAYPYIHQQKGNVIDSMMQKHKHALFITVLRDPIERILSEYEFEWKFGCQQCRKNAEILYQHGNDSMNENNFMDYSENATSSQNAKFSNILLEQFMNRVEKYQLNNPHFHDAGAWEYAQYLNNYYLWIFCCNDRKCKVMNNTRYTINECYQRSKQILNKLHLVLISEWLFDSRTAVYVNHVINDYITHKNTPFTVPFVDCPQILKTKEWLYYGHISNTMIPSQVYKRLLTWNQWDIKLYQYAQHQSYTQTQRICNHYGTCD